MLESRSGLAPAAFVGQLATVAHLPVLDARVLFAGMPAFEALPFAEALRRECLALRDAGGSLLLVVADPYDFALRDWAEARLPETAGLRLAHRADILAWLAHHEESLRAMESMGRVDAGTSGNEVVEDLSLRTISEDSSPVVRLVNSTLYDALKAGASDIHLESTGQGMVIKQRLDGVLVAVGSPAGADVAEQVISRIKVMAELDIAERRVPQDGRFRVSRQGREVDVRVSIMRVQQDDVVGLYISVDDAQAVRVVERLAALEDQFENSRDRQQVVDAAEFLQRGPVHVLHHDVAAVLVRDGVVDTDDMWMLQLPGK